MNNDVADWIAGQIDTIGLATGDSVSDEVSGNGYAPLSPAYGSASSGTSDISATLEFDGPNGVEVTHLIFRTGETVWAVRPVDSSASFNSDGRLDVTSAPITAEIG